MTCTTSNGSPCDQLIVGLTCQIELTFEYEVINLIAAPVILTNFDRTRGGEIQGLLDGEVLLPPAGGESITSTESVLVDFCEELEGSLTMVEARADSLIDEDTSCLAGQEYALVVPP